MSETFREPDYRILKHSEKVLPGDECWGVYSQRWLSADHTVTEQYAMPYRRKIKQTEEQ